ncbi:MAG: aromatic amino acid hydroxylase [Candidatus Cloacimonetes bacterium]|nr:aromatic amino acid hydroxylase [Candidatus Cloacimonadota bacterium]
MAAMAQVREIPGYLTPYIARQEYDKYTAIDHAAWRYIMRVAGDFFTDHAYSTYLRGLAETGINTERIPRLEEMNACLNRFGWQAVAVSGFIPPQVFMEFQSLGIMPIACDMRKLENITYTPAPDIVHEAAGHAPMVADMDYRQYLINYGEVSRKAIFSWEDIELYDAIRQLSEMKENPTATDLDVENAQRQFEEKAASISWISEATELSRMYWWTVEYGLVGSLEKPQIYGAGLLSSIGESFHCLSEDVTHLPMDVSCVHQEFDITRPQPQLFVTPDFTVLSEILEEYAATMAFRVGGLKALEEARRARTVTTTVLDTGLQISGILQDIRVDLDNRPFFLRYSDGVQLSQDDIQLEGHGREYHAQGFSSPIGRIKNLNICPGELSDTDLERMGFRPGQRGRLEFASGIVVDGELISSTPGKRDRRLLLSFRDCTVTQGMEVLFRPEWGTFDMACGDLVESVFGGPADRSKFVITRPPRQLPRQKTNHSDARAGLEEMYATVRRLRESNPALEVLAGELGSIAGMLSTSWSQDWLLRLEILELCANRSLRFDFLDRLHGELDTLEASSPMLAEVIQRGRKLL